jgi:16S rRNA (uracil1498-N3)-methyltransferase
VFVVDGSDLEAAVPGSVVVVTGAEGRHAVTVRRVRVGEGVDLVDGSGRRASGQVSTISGKDSLMVTVTGVTLEQPHLPRVTVVQALAKGDRGELAVELLTEIGVDRIVPWAAARCVTQWRDDRADRQWKRWADAAISAAKQSRRAVFPVVSPLATTGQVVALLQTADAALVLHERAVVSIGSITVPESGDLVVVVGPEGGLAPGELSAFEAVGAVSVRLGPSVLRTSSAGMAAVAALLARTRRWSVPPEADVAAKARVEGWPS